jgi:hypothetical protein
MKAAGHSSRTTTWLYTITDQERAREHVKLIWDRVTGHATGGFQLSLNQHAVSTERFEQNRISALVSGGPDRTRICDLYRVKVAL